MSQRDPSAEGHVRGQSAPWYARPCEHVDDPLWRDLWASRLLEWILSCAKRGSGHRLCGPGQMFFSFDTARRAIALDNPKHVPGRKAVRGALERLQARALVRCHSGARRRAQARAYHGFVVEIQNWAFYDNPGKALKARGAQARARASGAPRAQAGAQERAHLVENNTRGSQGAAARGGRSRMSLAEQQEAEAIRQGQEWDRRNGRDDDGGAS